MSNLFAPVKDLIGAVYDFLYDCAEKVWSLAKPVILIGLLIDLVSGQLGWIAQILEYYRRTLDYTAGASWLVLVVFGVVALAFFNRKG